jgi:hypothetical protein
MKIQVTLFCNNGKYKPISTLVDAENLQDFEQHLEENKKKALKQISDKRYKDGKDIYNSGYTIMKYRPYDKKDRFMEMMMKGRN